MGQLVHLMMRVQELWRFPVKSMQGERLDMVRLDADGLEGDRRYALFDLDTGFGLTGRRVPELLFASAALTPSGVRVTLPDGSVAEGDEALSDWLGRRVALRSARQVTQRRYENVIDPEHEATSGWQVFDGASGPFHDAARARVSLVSTTTMRSWDRRRFRANVVFDGAGEDDLIGTSVALGTAAVDVVMGLQRCVMVTRPQPGGIDSDLDVLRTIVQERNTRLAVGAQVTRTGAVQVGDDLLPYAA